MTNLSQTRPNGSGSPVPGGEFAFSWADFHKIAALVHGEAGIVLPESKANLVYSRLAKRLRAIGLRSFREYCTLVEGAEGIDERQALIAAMTTNVTKFFREPHHFEHMTKTAMPAIMAAAKRGERIRLWSAACSSGEEPYSIALTVLRSMPDAHAHDLLILATDIDQNMIAHAQNATYPDSRLNDIPREMRGSYTAPERSADTPSFRFTDEVRDLIRFRQLNLLRDWPVKGTFNVIFCRNVMIYFDQPTQDGIWARFGKHMTPSSFLYIGHSERIATDAMPFDLKAQTTYSYKGAKR